VSQEAMVAFLASLSVLALVLESARLAYKPLNRVLVSWLKPILKKGEERKVTAATFMILASLGCFLFFDKGIAVAAMLFISVGDPLASLVGSRAQSLRLWGKSPWGSLALFSSAAGLALVLAATNVASPLWVLLVGGAVAAITELLPLPIDDNATVPLVAGGAMVLMTL
jgi:glycerol-3-phosphate acyltransferase PlsY